MPYSCSAAMVDEFIAQKATSPTLTLVPDSIYLDDIRTFSRYYIADVYFRTLDGVQYLCRSINRHGASTIKLNINDDSYRMEKPAGYPLFTFDSRLYLRNGERLDYEYIVYAHENRFEETLSDSEVFSLSRYSSSSDVNEKDSNGKYPVLHVFSLNEDLSSTLESIGFDTNFSKNESLFDSDIVSDNVARLEWKLRSLVEQESIKEEQINFSASFYKSTMYTSYNCAGNNLNTYYNTAYVDDLSMMRRWFHAVFPDWS